MELKQDILVRKNGGKVHRAFAGSSVTTCGFWLKTESNRYGIGMETAENVKNFRSVLCEKCFTNIDATIEYLESNKAR